MKGRLATGVAWLTGARILTNLISFASTLVLARILAPADFGLVAIATTVTAIVTSMTELSLSAALVHHKDLTDDHYHSAWTINLARAAIVGGIICTLAYPVGALYGDSRLVPVMFVLAATTLAGGLINPKLVVFLRDLVFWQEFAIGVSQKLVGFLLAASIAIAYQTYWALIAGLAAGQAVTLVLSYLFVPYRPKLRLTEIRALLSFSIWLSLGQALNTLNWKLDHLLVGYFLGPVALGYYTVGDNLAVLPTREVTAPLAQALFPSFAKMRHEPPRLRSAYERAQSLQSAIALPAGIGFALVAEPFILLTMGPKWQPAVIVVQVLASIFALQTLATSAQPLATALGHTRMLFARDMINFAIRVPLIVAGMVAGGLVGVVYARCLSGLISTIIHMAIVRRLLALPMRAQFIANMRSLASVGAMAIVTYLVGRSMGEGQDWATLATKLLCMVAAGALTYIGVHYCLWRAAGRPQGPERELLQLVPHFGASR